MTIPEQGVIREGFELLRVRLDGEIQRDPAAPGTWPGLGAADRFLLKLWMESIGKTVEQLYLDVALGLIASEREGMSGVRWKPLYLATHPLRIDAVVITAAVVSIVEIKPDAGYVALGQLLTYRHYAETCFADCDHFECVVLTDKVQDVIRPVFERHDVRIVEMGGVADGNDGCFGVVSS